MTWDAPKINTQLLKANSGSSNKRMRSVDEGKPDWKRKYVLVGHKECSRLHFFACNEAVVEITRFHYNSTVDTPFPVAVGLRPKIKWSLDSNEAFDKIRKKMLNG